MTKNVRPIPKNILAKVPNTILGVRPYFRRLASSPACGVGYPVEDVSGAAKTQHTVEQPRNGSLRLP